MCRYTLIEHRSDALIQWLVVCYVLIIDLFRNDAPAASPLCLALCYVLTLTRAGTGEAAGGILRNW
jgi:hypothetical protein